VALFRRRGKPGDRGKRRGRLRVRFTLGVRRKMAVAVMARIASSAIARDPAAGQATENLSNSACAQIPDPADDGPEEEADGAGNG